MSGPDPFWLDRALGDPVRDDGPMGFRSAVGLDESEDFPTEASAILDSLGVQRHYVPSSAGGDLRSFSSLALVLRAVARRDVTLAVGHGKTLLGTQPVFLAAEGELQRQVAVRVLAGEPVALALTERATGSDLLASTTRALGSAPWRITGEKWLINNASRATALSVFARTRPGGGPRGFSVFWVDKGACKGTHVALPRVKTHGIRGADISGIRFEGAPCWFGPVGGEGAGLSVILKTFAVTRTLIAAVAVGAVDSALRIVVEFARSRPIYGGTVLQIPHARSVLASAFADLLACEAVALSGARILHTSPEQAGFWSAVVKYDVPVTCERLVRDLAVVFGARHYLREDHASGMFQKILRDISILSVFDGHTLINLSNLSLHANALIRGDADDLSLGGALCLVDPVPQFSPQGLSIATARTSGAEQLVRESVERISTHNHGPVLRPMLEALGRRAASVRDQMAGLVPRNSFDMTAELARLAGRYASMASAALAAATYVQTAAKGVGVLAAGDWIVLRLARELDGHELPESLVESCRQRLLHSLLRFVDERITLSLLVDSKVTNGHDQDKTFH